MLNGLDPIIIFQFSKLFPAETGATIARIPIVSQIPTVIDAPPIPIYLSEQITGLYIDSEDKNIDIETMVETKTDGSTADVQQKGINDVVTINIKGNKNSLGLTLLTTMASLILDRATSKEYAITYMHGAITVFRGLLHSFNVNQDSNSELLFIKIELAKGAKTPQKAPDVPVVEKLTGAVPL